MVDASSKTRFDRMSGRQRATVIGGVCLALFVILFALAEGVVRVRAWLKHGQAIVRIEDSYRFDEQIGLRVRCRARWASPDGHAEDGSRSGAEIGLRKHLRT